MNRIRKLLGYGGAIIDLLMPVSEEFLAGIPGGKAGALELDVNEMAALLAALPESPRRQPGGAVANSLRLFAELGGQCSFLTRIGGDEDGEYFRDSLRNCGVGTELFVCSEKNRTGCCLSMITPDGERTMRTYQGAAADFRAEDCPPASLANFSHLLLEGYAVYFPESLVGLCRCCREAGLQIIFDLSAWEIVRNHYGWLQDFLAENVDMVIANELECQAMSPSGNLADGETILRRLCRDVVVKYGIRGAKVWLDDRETVIPAYPADAVDTTGAGDAWAAGFLYGLSREWSPLQAGKLGARLSSAIVQVLGASLPAVEVKKILSEIHIQE